LNSGADGILFDLKKNVQAEQLLEGIEVQYCNVFFILNDDLHSFPESFKSLVETKKVQPTGAFYFEGASAGIVEINNFRTQGLKIDSVQDSAEQISLAFRSAAARLHTLTESGMRIERALHSLAFRWPVKVNFFQSVLEMKAVRVLWDLFCEAYGVRDSTLFLHAWSPAWTVKNFEPHSNLIKQTTSGLAAVLGVCDAITCDAENEDTSMLIRTARNISSILKEESHLDKVWDPLAGAYFIEQASTSLAESAWRKFQEIV
jgi:methylmalonyl-CoA mutase